MAFSFILYTVQLTHAEMISVGELNKEINATIL